MASLKPSLTWLSNALRALIWVVILGVGTFLFFYMPVLLLCIGAVLGVILIASLVIGGLFWNGNGRPTSAPPSNPSPE